jgi:hypothetical protein
MRRIFWGFCRNRFLMSPLHYLSSPWGKIFSPFVKRFFISRFIKVKPIFESFQSKNLLNPASHFYSAPLSYAAELSASWQHWYGDGACLVTAVWSSVAEQPAAARHRDVGCHVAAVHPVVALRLLVGHNLDNGSLLVTIWITAPYWSQIG